METTWISLVKDLPSNAEDTVQSWVGELRPHMPRGNWATACHNQRACALQQRPGAAKKKKKITEMKQTQWLTAHT